MNMEILLIIVFSLFLMRFPVTCHLPGGSGNRLAQVECLQSSGVKEHDHWDAHGSTKVPDTLQRLACSFQRQLAAASRGGSVSTWESHSLALETFLTP